MQGQSTVARRSNLINMPPDGLRATERKAALVEFARRFSRQLVLKGWSQAEFVRRAQALAQTKGLDIRVGPDSVSSYLRGLYLPSAPTMNLMAEVFGVDVIELLPPRGIPEAGESLPPVGVQDQGDGLAWLRVNQAVPWPVALKILALLHGEDEETKG